MKKALVTGGTSGIGLSVARALVKDGFDVSFVGSNPAKGKAAEAELNAGAAGVGRFVQLDLSDIKAVKAFASAFREENEQLHLLANIAGVVLPNRQETVQGLEKTITVGYLSAVVICRELTPLLQRTEHARVINVSGAPSQVLKSNLDFDDLMFQKSYSGWRAAIKTVHAKTVFSQVLADELKDSGVDVNAFHPGGVKSDLGQNFGFPIKQLFAFAMNFMSRDSATGVAAATSEALTGVTGQFLTTPNKKTPLVFDEGYRMELMRATDALLARAL